MEYSKIKSFRVKNFRIIGDITIDFKDSPIIALVGDNESGKTSIVKAFIVASMNGLQSKQKAFIREGQIGFGLEIVLEDGTVVTRIKTSALNKIKVQKPNQEPWEVTKIDRGMGIPVELQEVMGLIEEPETKEYLQIRTYEDQLLFVVTSGSTNYKVMYDALKVEQLTRALRLGTEEANMLKRALDNNTFMINELMSNIRQIRITDIEPLVNIKERMKKQLSLLDKLERAVELNKENQAMREMLASANQLSELGEIEENKVSLLVNAKRAKDSLDRLKQEQKVFIQLDSADEISIDSMERLEKLQRARRLKAENESIEINIGAFAELSKAEEISEAIPIKLSMALVAMQNKSNIEQLYRVYQSNNAKMIEDTDMESVNKLIYTMQKRNEVYADYNGLVGIKSELERLTELLKNSGAVVADCPSCGETVIVDARV